MARNVRSVGSPAREIITGFHTVAQTTPSRITERSKELINGIVVKADALNTNTVWVSQNSSMTLGTGTGEGSGFPLAAGEEYFFPFDNVNKCLLVSDASAQKVFFYYS